MGTKTKQPEGIDVVKRLHQLEQQNKELKQALMETDLYYRNEVKIPNLRICKINFDLIGKSIK